MYVPSCPFCSFLTSARLCCAGMQRWCERNRRRLRISPKVDLDNIITHTTYTAANNTLFRNFCVFCVVTSAVHKIVLCHRVPCVCLNHFPIDQCAVGTMCILFSCSYRVLIWSRNNNLCPDHRGHFNSSTGKHQKPTCSDYASMYTCNNTTTCVRAPLINSFLHIRNSLKKQKYCINPPHHTISYGKIMSWHQNGWERVNAGTELCPCGTLTL